MSLDLRDIVVADLRRHYAGDDYSEEYAIELATELIRIGQIFESENVLIRYHKVDDETIEFHCMNAGSGTALPPSLPSLLPSLPLHSTPGVRARRALAEHQQRKADACTSACRFSDASSSQ